MHLIKFSFMFHVVNLNHVGILYMSVMGVSYCKKRRLNVPLLWNRHTLLGHGSGRIE